jgi:aminoglycoside 3-N-acetyltransferase
MQETPNVTRDVLLGSLRALGVRPGDAVFVHGSLSRFGHVEGGAETVCRSLVDAVGEDGTVIMPAFTFRLRDVDDPVLDVANEPSCVGRISETFRTGFATHRSRHITHSVSAAGADAEFFTRDHCRTAFDEHSSFRKLVDRGGMVLLFGVDYNRCTIFHAMESALPVPYLGMVPKADAKLLLPDGSTVPADCSIHKPTEQYDFNRAAGYLEGEGLAGRETCGNAILRGFRAAPVFERVLAELKRDPLSLVLQGKPVPVPTSATPRRRSP